MKDLFGALSVEEIVAITAKALLWAIGTVAYETISLNCQKVEAKKQIHDELEEMNRKGELEKYANT